MYNRYGKFKNNSQVKIYNSKNGFISHQIKIFTKTNTLCILSGFSFYTSSGSKAEAKTAGFMHFSIRFFITGNS